MPYRGIDPAAIAEDGSYVKAVEDLVRAWFWAQEQRGPTGRCAGGLPWASRATRDERGPLPQAAGWPATRTSTGLRANVSKGISTPAEVSAP